MTMKFAPKRSSFASGEISTTLFARDDLAKWQNGLAKVEGFSVLLEGGLKRISGTRFVSPLKNEAQMGRLQKFRYTITDNYVLVFNAGTLQIVKDGGFVDAGGGVPYEIAIPYTQAALPDMHFQQQGNQVFIVAKGIEPQVLTRSAPLSWSISPYRPVAGPVDTQNLDFNKKISTSGVTGIINLYGTNTSFDTGDIGGIYRLDDNDLGSTSSWSNNEIISSPSSYTVPATAFGSLTGGAGLISIYNQQTNVASGGCASSSGFSQGYVGLQYPGTSINKAIIFGSNDKGFHDSGGIGTLTFKLWGRNGSPPVTLEDGTQLGQYKIINTSNESSGRTIYSKDTTSTWQYIWVSLDYASGAGSLLVSELQFWTWDSPAFNKRRYNGRVYLALNDGDTGVNPPSHENGDASSGQFNTNWRYLNSGYGTVRITGVSSAVLATGVVISNLPATLLGVATYRWSAPGWSPKAGWPTRIHAHDGCLFFARDDYFWLTRPSNINSMEIISSLNAANPDSAIAIKLKSHRNNIAVIEWAQSTSVLLLGLTDGERIVRSPNEFDALSIDKIRALPQSAEGSAAGQDPIDVHDGVIFIGLSRKRLHFLRYESLRATVQVEEITISSRHILNGLASRMAWQRDPDRTAWIVCQSGELIGVTFVPAQQVTGFFRAPRASGSDGLTGFIEDIAENLSSDLTRNEIYMIIRRVINSLTRRYVELMQKSFEPLNTALPTAQGAWYVDAGLRYQGAPATIMSGLDHLEGMDVYGLADGSKFASKRVTGGSITLEQSASDVCIGLPLRAFIRSLPIEIDTPQGTSKGKIKRVHHIVLDMVDAYGGRIRVNEGPWSEIFESGDLGYGQSPTLFTGSKRISVEHASDTSIYVELECNDPYPFTLAGWTVEMNVEPA